MKHRELRALTAALAPVIREYIAEEFGTVLERLAAVEAALAAPPAAPELPDISGLVDDAVEKAVKNLVLPAAEKGEPGKDANPAEVAERLLPEVEKAVSGIPAIVADAVSEEVAKLPPPEKGEPGRPGKDADPTATAALVEKKVAEAVAAIPKPKDGESVDPEQVAKMVAAEVARAVKEIPTPKDGLGMAGAMIDREGGLLITMTDGSVRELGKVVGRDGDPGENGVGFDDLEVLHDGVRGFKFRFVRGAQVKEYGFNVAVVLDRGVWVEERDYQKGDGVTYGGNYWIAQKDAPEDQPGTGSGWRLAVRKGRDGKDGVLKEKTPQAPVRGFPGDKKGVTS